MNANLRYVVCLAAALLFCNTAQAQYLWLQRDGAGTQVYAGELHKPLAALPALQNQRAALADGDALPLTAQANYLTVAAVPTPGTGDLRFTAVQPNGSVLLYHQARFGRTETRARNELELVPTEPNGNTFQLVLRGRQVAASQLRIDTSEGWRRVLASNKDGTFTFQPAFPGLYVLEVTVRVNNSGPVTLDGKTYDDVRYAATLSFEVEK